MNIDKELFGASTSLIILQILSRGPNYGYDIVKTVNIAAGGAFTWQEGSIYPVLMRMKKEGLLECKWEEAESGHHRKYYSITQKGKEALKEGAKKWKILYHMVTYQMEAYNG